MIGVTAQDPDSLTSLPSTANSIKISPWIVVNNAVYVNGNKVGKAHLKLSDNFKMWLAKSQLQRVMKRNQCENELFSPLKPL